MSLAQKVITAPGEICEKENEDLRALNLSESEILDIVLTSAISNFFSRTLEAVHTEPDLAHLELEPDLLENLTLGSPFPEKQD